jgi:hypothetical protein
MNLVVRARFWHVNDGDVKATGLHDKGQPVST